MIVQKQPWQSIPRYITSGPDSTFNRKESIPLVRSAAMKLWESQDRLINKSRQDPRPPRNGNEHLPKSRLTPTLEPKVGEPKGEPKVGGAESRLSGFEVS